MAKYVINGGNKLDGKIEAESAKNAVLPLLAASILTDEKVVLKNCPHILDVVNMINILLELGVKVSFEGKNLIIEASSINKHEISCGLTRELRSSVFMLGSVVARMGAATVAYPGGCDIGLRPIDLHLGALRKLGVKIYEDGGVINCRSFGLKGSEIYLDFPSVGATENVMLAAVLAKGTTLVRNAAKEPEVEDLQNFLNAMGAHVAGAGTDLIRIEGVKKLHGAEYRPIFDRIETGTFLVAAAITGGNVEISGCNPEKISSALHKLRDNSCTISVKNDIIYLQSGKERKPFTIETSPYPGFPTDLQAQMLALASVSEGVSVIRENIFETRFRHVGELARMGADISVKDRTAIVRGVERLHGAEVAAYDLRGGAATVLAGLNAEGTTVVNGIRHIERGYFDFDKKLRSLGADITISI